LEKYVLNILEILKKIYKFTKKSVLIILLIH